MSTSLATCYREVMHHLGGIPLHNMVEVEFEVDLKRVIDLTDPKQCQDLGIEPDDFGRFKNAINDIIIFNYDYRIEMKNLNAH